MPELPEVETIRSDLEKRILNKKISKIKILDPKIEKAGSFLPVDFLVGRKIKKADRIGKLLIFDIAGGYFLLIHLKMTGQLIFKNKKETIAGGHQNKGEDKQEWNPENKYSRIIFTFSDFSKLYFNDLRKFGYLKIVAKKELEKIKSDFGPEPLAKNYTFKNFKKSLANKKTNIKQALLNQKNIAGIGNIYADEILFASRVNPLRPANSLSEKELSEIFKAGKIIIKKAIKYRGTTFNNYVDSQGAYGNFSRFLKVYGRKGEKCARCKTIIKKAKIAGRGTHFCPHCQNN